MGFLSAISRTFQRGRLRVLVAALVLSLLFFSSYRLAHWPNSARGDASEPIDDVPEPFDGLHVPNRYMVDNPNDVYAPKRANATLVMLARNSDLDGAIRSVQGLEDRFNHQFHYPWVFLNDDDFTDDFVTRMSAIVSGEIRFGRVPREHWVQPDWIDEKKAADYRSKLMEVGIIYGDNVAYRNMCRFNSGFFYRHPLLQPYKWYWRVEPDVEFTCNINFDPFHFMQDNRKTYGFTIAPHEFRETVPTLWNVTKDFIRQHPEFVAEDNGAMFVSDNDSDGYNLCHFWSNFEIADMDFWRGPAYTAYFNHLEANGGFYYERWGDAPVHSIAAALFLPQREIHFFEEIGYAHSNFNHCPKDDVWTRGKCSCRPSRSFDYHGFSCKWRWDMLSH